MLDNVIALCYYALNELYVCSKAPKVIRDTYCIGKLVFYFSIQPKNLPGVIVKFLSFFVWIGLALLEKIAYNNTVRICALRVQ